MPLPSFEYACDCTTPYTNVSSAGRMDFLVGPDSPSFTDIDSAYRAFFLGKYDLPRLIRVGRSGSRRRRPRMLWFQHAGP
jgi:hypothetical protein